MDVFVWDQYYLTGEPQIDEEHQVLVQLVNEVVSREQSVGAETGNMQSVIDRLIEYAATHFAHEETLMLRHACDARHVELHCSAHRNFARQVEEMRGQGSLGLDPEYLMRFLSSWLAFHILGMDQSLARQLRSIRAGMAPDQAWEADKQVVTDPATAGLLRAMHVLHGVITRRNEQLLDFNEKLEDTVRARTADLEARNAELLDANQRLAEMRRQLLQAEKLASLGQLAAGVAHEINNPLSFVLSNLNTLGQYQSDLLELVDAGLLAGAHQSTVGEIADRVDLGFLRSDGPVLLEECRVGLERVRKIVQDLLDFSKVDRSDKAGWHSLAQCVARALTKLENRLGPDIQVSRDLPELPDLWCCAPRITQVLAVLFSNAIEAMPHGGQLRVRSGQTANEQWLEVEDSGIGIPEEALPKIFDPFYTTKQVGTGTGMGLAQAWGIVQQHQGRIEVRSTPGSGSVFTVFLPIRAETREG